MAGDWQTNGRQKDSAGDSLAGVQTAALGRFCTVCELSPCRHNKTVL